MNSFDVLKTMSERNMNIKSFPVTNVTYASTGKRHGTLTIMVDNETVSDIMTGKPIIFSLIVADATEFEALKGGE